jgi:hypothetical protein
MQMSTLGTMIYRGACVAAVGWAAFILLWSAYLAHPDWTIYAPIAIAAQLLFGALAALPITSYLGDRRSSKRLEPLLS